ncbi:MAG: Lrp/AsnC family transcriptional regulator [Deltaproteobacteria bacterium]|nr:Lrp/AsnC family transcriptional regulator [Deltaproteobacteria bacterium]
MLTETEKKVVAALQGDMPVEPRPYRTLAKQAGITEDAFIAVVADLAKRGVIRRFGATLKHQNSGFTANAMAAWQVDDARADELGRLFASFDEVSHCYRRLPAETWPYTLYTMIHATSEQGVRETARRMAEQAGVSDYVLLFSVQELKKTSMEYFPSDEDD